MGFYLRAIKDSERAARSLGVAAGRYKLYAYMLSAGLTAVAGSLYAIMFGFVDPESGCGILISVKMLIMGALGGAGLLLVASTGWSALKPFDDTPLMAVILVLGVAIIGAAHGMINAPVVTHVAKSRLAMLLGESSVTATYRFVERLGHITGPMIVGQLFLFGGQNPSMLGFIGMAVMLFGLLFVLRFSSPKEAMP